MYISKKKTYKILACAMSAIFLGTINSGVASADSSNNEITVTTYDEFLKLENTVEVSSGEALNNKVTIRNLNLGSSFLHSGYVYGGNGNANGNWLWVHDVTVEHIHAGHANNGNANENHVFFYSGNVTNEIGAGYSNYGNADNNHLNILGGVITGTVYGGCASYKTNAKNVNAIGNYMNISGGEIHGTIYGGWAPNGKAENNEINIYGNPNLVDAILIAGEGATVSDNTLKIHTKDLKVYDIQGFENLNFYLPANTVANDTILTVTNPTQKISNNIYVFKDKALNLNDDDTVTLITTTDETKGLILGEVQPTDENDSDYLKITKVPVSDENPNIIKSLTINAKDITRITPIEEEEKNKMNPSTPDDKGSTIFNEGVADSVSLLDSGTDRLLDWLPPEGLDYLNSSPTAGFDPFIGIGGSKLEIDTGNGTKLKTKSGGINFGMTRYLKNRHGIFIIAPVIDYGQDSYESTLDDANRTQGSGHSKYLMGGLIARQACVNGMYYEASMRGGKIKTDFHSDNFLVNNVPTSASYEASTPCFAGHLRIGWRNHISPKNILDVYGMYSLNHIKGFKTTVSTGEDYSFSTVNSGRMRIGARLTRELKERESVYSSLSFIHEFTGTTTGEYMGMSTKRTGLKGSAGLIELGWQVKPTKNSATMIDTSISCWVGDRKGFIFATKLKKDF